MTDPITGQAITLSDLWRDVENLRQRAEKSRGEGIRVYTEAMNARAETLKNTTLEPTPSASGPRSRRRGA